MRLPKTGSGHALHQLYTDQPRRRSRRTSQWKGSKSSHSEETFQALDPWMMQSVMVCLILRVDCFENFQTCRYHPYQFFGLKSTLVLIIYNCGDGPLIKCYDCTRRKQILVLVSFHHLAVHQKVFSFMGWKFHFSLRILANYIPSFSTSILDYFFISFNRTGVGDC